MKAPSKSSSETGRRRLLVTLVIATAAAAVTAGVALNERHPGAAVGQRAVASPVTDDGLAAAAKSRHAPLSEAAPSSTADFRDPSLPPAGEAIKRVSGESGEPTPTF